MAAKKSHRDQSYSRLKFRLILLSSHFSSFSLAVKIDYIRSQSCYLQLDEVMGCLL